MNSFYHSVTEAVSSSLSQNLPLAILIKLEDDTWADEVFLGTSFERKAVLLRLKPGSEDYKNYIDIFHNPLVPCLHVVAKGTTLDLISGDLPTDDFLARLKKSIGLEEDANNLDVPKKKVLCENESKICNQQLAVQRKLDSEERERVRQLIESDKLERKKLQGGLNSSTHGISRPLLDDSNKISRPLPVSATRGPYMLQVKLFSGQTVKVTLEAWKTLNDVRTHLDSLDECQVTAYYFFNPVDRKTFSDVEEFSSLAKLQLNRASLILRPLDQRRVSTQNPDDYGSFKWFKMGVTKLGGYIGGMFTRHEIEQDDESKYSTPINSRSATPFNPQLTLNSSTSTFSLHHPRHPKKDDDRRQVYNGNHLSLEDEDKTRHDD